GHSLPTAGPTCPFPVEPSIPSAYPSKSFHVERTQGHPCTARPSLYPSVGSAPPRILRKAVQHRFLVKRPRAAFARVFLHPGFTGNGSRGVPCRLRASFSASRRAVRASQLYHRFTCNLVIDCRERSAAHSRVQRHAPSPHRGIALGASPASRSRRLRGSKYKF